MIVQTKAAPQAKKWRAMAGFHDGTHLRGVGFMQFGSISQYTTRSLAAGENRQKA
jgi:hypothetical protein